MTDEEKFDPRLRHPFRLICSGASSTGKSRLFGKIIKNGEKMMDKKIDRLIVCYAVYQPLYSEWIETAPVTIFRKGLPSEEELEDESLIRKKEVNVMVIDDLDDRENECETIHRLFTIYSHHFSCSVLYSQHNLFMKNKRSVLINRNANYLILMPNSRDKAGVRMLGYQTHPENSKFLMDAFVRATEGSEGGGWLLCDFTPFCPKQFRFRETLTRGEPVAYYLPLREDSSEERKRDKRNGADKKKRSHV